MQDGVAPHIANVSLHVNTCFGPSCHVKPLSRLAQLRKLLVTCQPGPYSLQLLFVGSLEGSVPTETIQ